MDDKKRYAKYKNNIIVFASQAVMDDRIMVSHLIKIPERNFATVPTKCPIMFTGRVEAQPCQEFRNKFPNLYMELMQYKTLRVYGKM